MKTTPSPYGLGVLRPVVRAVPHPDVPAWHHEELSCGHWLAFRSPASAPHPQRRRCRYCSGAYRVGGGPPGSVIYNRPRADGTYPPVAGFFEAAIAAAKDG